MERQKSKTSWKEAFHQQCLRNSNTHLASGNTIQIFVSSQTTNLEVGYSWKICWNNNEVFGGSDTTPTTSHQTNIRGVLFGIIGALENYQAQGLSTQWQINIISNNKQTIMKLIEYSKTQKMFPSVHDTNKFEYFNYINQLHREKFPNIELEYLQIPKRH
jgi:hypothetical protein